MNRNSVKSAETKKELLKLEFGKERKAWDGEKDDRGVFCNIYDMLMEALDDMKSVENSFIWVAFNNKFREEEKTLKEIKKRFVGGK